MSSSPEASPPRVLAFVGDRALTEDESRFMEKVLRSAKVEGKFHLLGKAPREGVMVALGAGVANALVGKKSLQMGKIEGQELTAGPRTVVPIRHPGWLLQHGMKAVEKTVAILKQVRDAS